MGQNVSTFHRNLSTGIRAKQRQRQSVRLLAEDDKRFEDYLTFREGINEEYVRRVIKPTAPAPAMKCCSL